MRPEDEDRLQPPQAPKLYSEPPSISSSKSALYKARRRSGCLMFWLVLYLISVGLTIVIVLPVLYLLIKLVSPLLLLLLFADLVVMGVAVYLILQWKRFGVQLFIVTMFLSLLLQGLMRMLDIRAIVSVLFSLGMLWYFVRPHWDDYEE